MQDDLWGLLVTGFGETLYMVGFSTVLALLLGLPLGVALVLTSPGHLLSLPAVHKILESTVNATRSFPFIILIVLLLPLARLLVGTTLGSTAAVVPLAIGSAPFLARIIENSLKEVERGKIEAAVAMGTAPLDIVVKVLIPEAMASLVRGITLAIITITSFSATAGAIGAGGLGSLAIRYGYQRYRDDIMVATVLVLILLVQGIQWSGNRLALTIDRRRHQVQ
ncbi:ABC transporter permease subunit [Heliobacterium gestii]|uniref:ABC transporter permease subunit n=1 Tax=Heliomicrobium gestii TaxID=2699 RepID=A0A845LBF5_HELGE|nr:methionine ABC transporter permease [Heliomicrobium gestii]MBM7865595.1 D-methionine transport system permease protein [Heliomicrobium gestii]MZP41845.1 ABC transporter permease subunit [Heliomicrobium gestii]